MNVSANVRQANYEDFKKIVQWSTEQCDWELCAEDYLVWRRYIPLESFIAVDDKDGNLTGFIAAVKHDQQNAGQITMFYVKEGRRGEGFGAKLFEHATKYLKGRNLFLCSEPDMMAKYRDRSGFKIASDWDTLDAVGKLCNFKNFFDSTASLDHGGVITKNATRDHFKFVLAYDKQITNQDREQYLENWLFAHPTGTSAIAFDDSNKVIGYGTVRLIRKGDLKIEPLYADSETVARKLIAHLLSAFDNIENRALRFFFRSNDDRTKQIVKDLGLQSPYSLTFMFTEKIIDNFDFSKVFCISGCDVNLIV